MLILPSIYMYNYNIHKTITWYLNAKILQDLDKILQDLFLKDLGKIFAGNYKILEILLR